MPYYYYYCHHHFYRASSLRPNPLKPTSRLKNLPMFFKLLSRFAPPSPPPAPAAPCCCPGAGLPNRSTPSRAAFTSRLPRPAASNRPLLRLGVPMVPMTLAALPLPEPAWISKGVRKGEFCTRLAWLGDARKAAKRSRSCVCSALRIPLRSRILRKLVSDLSAMWMR